MATNFHELFGQAMDLRLRRQVCEEQDGLAAGRYRVISVRMKFARVRFTPTMTMSAPRSASREAAASPRPLVASVDEEPPLIEISLPPWSGTQHFQVQSITSISGSVLNLVRRAAESPAPG